MNFNNNNKFVVLIAFLFVITFVVLYFDFSHILFNDLNFTNSNENEVIVETFSGALIGKTLNVLNKTVYSFIGVPYAEPPVGKLRFSSPQPIKKWFGLRSAFDFSPMCPQVIIPKNIIDMNYITKNISEDCLTLNIWSPDIRPKTLRTVMIWIHGGGFLHNSANIQEFDGMILSSFGDVVVVTVNYRVGAFGFLNTRNEGAPGNMGIYDQALALKWIKNNIKYFGGDPNKLVPFGESAGAISIGILMSYNQTKGLFSRAITQSGSFLLPQTSQTFENSKHFAKLVDCLDEDDPNQLSFDSFLPESIECLKSTPFERLYNASNQMLKKSYMPFMPSLDSYYEDIPPPMDYIFDENSYSNMKELMTGLVKDEGSFFVYILNTNLFKKDSYPELKTLSETREMFIDLIKNKTDIDEIMLHFLANNYINGPKSDSPEKNMQRLMDAFGNTIMNCPTVFLADEMVLKNKSVYMYLYEHRPKTSQYGEWFGTSHSSEVPFVFGYPLRRPEIYNKLDIEFSERIMKSWTHFAKTGNVLPQLNLVWPKYSQDNSFMVLNSRNSSIIKSLYYESCKLYKTIIQVNG